MNENLFDLLEHTFNAEGPAAGFDLLIHTLQQQKSYALVLEARLMQKRHAMGLPLIFAGTITDLPLEQQGPYGAAMTDAAREAGHSYLADGDIVNAWTYFRAIGEPGPVAAAIENVQSGEAIEGVLAIALVEGVSPRRGFELLLEHRGICDGISFATHGPDRETRVMFLQMLVKAFYNELMAHLKETIARVEGHSPDANRVAELITDRDWLFADGNFYIENSHLVSILQASPELDDPETMRLVIELADYGRRLAPIHHFRGQPPFEDPYVDYAEYLSALLGEHVDQSVAHFRRKVADSVRGAADVLVGLLGRLGRYDEAIQISLEHLGGEAGNGCLSAIQLCQMAGNYERLRDLARTEHDLLGFAAGVVQR